VLVAPWARIRSETAAQALASGPRTSGVYARFSEGGRALGLLAASGRTVLTLGAGTGLIAATRRGEDAPVWLVTGTNDMGVELAARAFGQGTLQDRFAVALAPSGAIALPAADRTATR
jgi:hypothetical protein